MISVVPKKGFQTENRTAIRKKKVRSYREPNDVCFNQTKVFELEIEQPSKEMIDFTGYEVEREVRYLTMWRSQISKN